MSAGENIASKFGAKLRQFRAAREMTQEALAEAAEISRGLLLVLEKGSGLPPRLDVVIRIAQALALPPAVFLPPSGVLADRPWETVAKRLELSYEDAGRLRSRAEEVGLAETGTIEEVLLLWMHERKVLP